MTLPPDCAIALEPPTEPKMPARQPQKRGVACYWLPSGKCMISPPTGMAGEAGMGGVDVCENNDR